jgi:mono/diheme cytochrome c family protein
MLRGLDRLPFVAFAAILLTGCGPKDVPPSGQGLYLQHCASCHGEKGDGQGPVASTLQRPPADLTRIAERNGGRFDASEVMSIIDGRRTVAAHGPREMPVWGAVFEDSVAPGQYPGYTSLLHSRALTEYLQSIQR